MAEAKSTPALPAETVAYLQSTIQGFARVNEEFLKELAFLNEMLEARAEATAQTDPVESSAVPNWDPALHNR